MPCKLDRNMRIRIDLDDRMVSQLDGTGFADCSLVIFDALWPIQVAKQENAGCGCAAKNPDDSPAAESLSSVFATEVGKFGPSLRNQRRQLRRTAIKICCSPGLLHARERLGIS